MKTNPVIFVLIALLPFFSGCSSAIKRAGTILVGSAVGAGTGYELGNKKPGATAIGAVAGAGVTALAMGKDQTTYKQGVDDGYGLGSSDATKRLYWIKQSLERRGSGSTGTRTSYYVYQGAEETSDGRRLVPNKVVVPVLEPVDEPEQPAAEPASSNETQNEQKENASDRTQQTNNQIK